MLMHGKKPQEKHGWREVMAETNELGVREHFDEYAATNRWQDLYEKDLNRDNVSFALRLDAFVDFVKQTNPGSVLDLGCGSGDYLLVLKSEGITYHGADISPEMITSLQKKIDALPEDERKRASCEVVALSEMDTKTKFDFVLASGFTEYFEDIDEVALKMAELTKSGGHIATQTPNRTYFQFKGIRHWQSEGKPFRHHRLTREELDEAHVKAGLEPVGGIYIDHQYFPKSRKWFPRLHYWLNDNFSASTPEFISRSRASGYVGLYKKP
jgi:2-polyprenyl-3-methyl-5-hydroxy-6-metoxy-1,4-benzoquinol methylase